MGRQLPAVPGSIEVVPDRAHSRGRLIGRAVSRNWLRSPLASAVVDATPDLLRLASRAARSAAAAPPAPGLPSSGANGMTVSEVEIDVASPFVRRIVVRSTNAWSVAPEVALASSRRRSMSGRLGIGAVSLASIALLGLAAIRRGHLALPERIRER